MKQNLIGGSHDTVATIKDQDKTLIKRKITNATQNHTRITKKNRIGKCPKDQLKAIQGVLAAKKDKSKEKVYKRYGN